MKQTNRIRKDNTCQGQKNIQNQTQIISINALRKIYNMIVNIHQTLLSRTMNAQIYRNLTKQQQQLLISVKNNSQIHTILAGLFAIDSCIKQVNQQEMNTINNLLKALTVLIENYRKIKSELNNQKFLQNLQNFIKFGVNFKFVLSLIYKIPTIKPYQLQIERHLKSFQSIERQMNVKVQVKPSQKRNNLIQELVKQNNELSSKITELQNFIITHKKNESKLILFDEMNAELTQKTQLIMRMNEEFIQVIKKYDRIFLNLENQNNMLKKYTDVDTAYILDELGYQIQRLRKQKRRDQTIISEVMTKINFMSCIQKDNYYKSEFAQKNINYTRFAQNPNSNRFAKHPHKFVQHPNRFSIINSFRQSDEQIPGRSSFLGVKLHNQQLKKRYHSPDINYKHRQKIDLNSLYKNVRIVDSHDEKQSIQRIQQITEVKSSDSQNRFSYKKNREDFICTENNQKRQYGRSKMEHMKRSLLQNNRNNFEGIKKQMKKSTLMQ